MKLHELADRPGARKKRSRIGRGIGSGTQVREQPGDLGSQHGRIARGVDRLIGEPALEQRDDGFGGRLRIAWAGGGCHIPPTTGRGDSVDITDLCFDATVLYVEPGTDVTWTNRDAMTHVVVGVGDCSQTDPPRVSQRAHHVEYHAGLPLLIEVEVMTHHDVEKIVRSKCAIQG